MCMCYHQLKETQIEGMNPEEKEERQDITTKQNKDRDIKQSQHENRGVSC